MKHFSGDISIVLGEQPGKRNSDGRGDAFVSVLKAEGYRIFASKESICRVSRRIDSTEIRIGRREPKAYVNRIDFLLALDKAVVEHLASRIGTRTIILGSGEKIGREDIHVIDVPFTRLSVELGNPVLLRRSRWGGSQDARGRTWTVRRIFAIPFARKGDEVVVKNLEAAAKGMDLGKHIAFMEGFEVTLKKICPYAMNSCLMAIPHLVLKGASRL